MVRRQTLAGLLRSVARHRARSSVPGSLRFWGSSFTVLSLVIAIVQLPDAQGSVFVAAAVGLLAFSVLISIRRWEPVVKYLALAIIPLSIAYGAWWLASDLEQRSTIQHIFLRQLARMNQHRSTSGSADPESQSAAENRGCNCPNAPLLPAGQKRASTPVSHQIFSTLVALPSSHEQSNVLVDGRPFLPEERLASFVRVSLSAGVHTIVSRSGASICSAVTTIPAPEQPVTVMCEEVP
jgi:hypothetical protein